MSPRDVKMIEGKDSILNSEKSLARVGIILSLGLAGYALDRGELIWVSVSNFLFFLQLYSFRDKFGKWF